LRSSWLIVGIFISFHLPDQKKTAPWLQGASMFFVSVLYHLKTAIALAPLSIPAAFPKASLESTKITSTPFALHN
jgi:hypothetical protein